MESRKVSFSTAPPPQRDLGETFHALVKEGNVQAVIKFLEQHKPASVKALVNKQNAKQQTPIFWAIEQKNQPMISLLLQYGADVRICEQHGFTPLHLAAYVGNLEVVKMIVKNGAEINAKNATGCTALHLASKANHKEIVAYLFEECKADPGITDKLGKVAKEYTTNPEIGSLLTAPSNRQEPQSLESKLVSLARRIACVRCSRHPRDTLILPCGHLLYCHFCAANLGDLCAECKQSITGMILCNWGDSTTV